MDFELIGVFAIFVYIRLAKIEINSLRLQILRLFEIQIIRVFAIP